MNIAKAVIDWQKKNGRHDLPWQANTTPYRVWLSEIMLQQTQVSTVKDYFLRFTKRFPSVEDLAAGSEDEVLALWTGLGYYSRARNLHKAAQIWVKNCHGGEPETLEQWMALPGIGRSTAGAILSLSQNQALPILDGNVKRVFARLLALVTYPGLPNNLKILWSFAEEQMPGQQVCAYNQGLMDLGAILCTRKNPNCGQCPLNKQCVSYAQGLTDLIPTPKPKRERPVENWHVLCIQNNQGRVFLQQRPSKGIWAKLWTPPIFESHDALCEHIGCWLDKSHSLSHALTHKQLHLHIYYQRMGSRKVEPGRWASQADLSSMGMPSVILKLLKRRALYLLS